MTKRSEGQSISIPPSRLSKVLAVSGNIYRNKTSGMSATRKTPCGYRWSASVRTRGGSRLPFTDKLLTGILFFFFSYLFTMSLDLHEVFFFFVFAIYIILYLVYRNIICVLRAYIKLASLASVYTFDSSNKCDRVPTITKDRLFFAPSLCPSRQNFFFFSFLSPSFVVGRTRVFTLPTSKASSCADNIDIFFLLSYDVLRYGNIRTQVFLHVEIVQRT